MKLQNNKISITKEYITMLACLW